MHSPFIPVAITAYLPPLKTTQNSQNVYLTLNLQSQYIFVIKNIFPPYWVKETPIKEI